ncbi:MAG: hypothetical protein HYX27_13405 [Acidobacteria bacterium]|nr:hypothetical protein [Acidobacteriota bacterium]
MQNIHCTFVGLDLGQRNDYSAVAIIDVVEETSNRRDPVTFAFYQTTRLHLRAIERVSLGASPGEIPSKIRPVVLKPPPGHFGSRLSITLAVDAGGPGVPVLEMLRQSRLDCHILGASIAANGTGVQLPNGNYSVSRSELTGMLRFVLENRLLVFPAELPLRDELAGELAAIESQSGQSKHDDMAMAIALALWAIPKRQPTLFERLAA